MMNHASSVLLLIAAGSLVGCGGSSGVTYGAIRGDLSPELQSLTERPVDIDRHLAATDDQNVRMLWDDLGATFYTDHPSRLSPFPIMSLSGQPR